MKSKDDRPEPAAELRRQAEEIARKEAAQSSEDLESLSPEGIRQTLHELRVHQIELEMQNEELRRTQAELDAARARYFDLYDLAPVGYCTLSEKGLILEANLTAATLLGVARGALVKQSISRFIFPEDQNSYYLFRKQLFETGAPQACELRMMKKDETAFWANLEATAAQDADGAPVCRVVMSDITARRQAEQALRESEARLRAIVQAVPDVLLVLDEEGRYVEVLTARPDLLYTEHAALQGRRLGERLPAAVMEQVLEAIRQTLQTCQIQSLEYELSIPKVGPRTFEVRLAPLDATLPGRPMVVLLAHDITQRRLTEESLRQAQKMEAVGQLTGGMAHDFNNLLAIILGNLELLAEQLQDPAMGSLVQEALVAVERGASLTHRLLVFARRQPLRSKRTDLNQLVAGMSDLLCRSLGETIALRTHLAENLLPTVIDPGQFEAALLNLVVNARDAMPLSGQLTIETANYCLHEDVAQTRLYEVEPGQYVMLAVGDTGSGMAPDVQRHAFEPFFTTKEVGQGSGLGLSMVYGLVKQSGGFIYLDSEVGQGTTLRLYLPAAGADAGTAVETPSEPVRPRSGQQQTILVVEDESAVRRMAVRMLESLGYQTVEADTAATALAVLEATPQVAALFTDVVLLGPLSGVELARQAVQRRPDLKVLFTSGYTEAHLSRFSDRPAGSDLLDKPYRKPQLAEKLHALLDRGAAAESG